MIAEEYDTHETEQWLSSFYRGPMDWLIRLFRRD